MGPIDLVHAKKIKDPRMFPDAKNGFSTRNGEFSLKGPQVAPLRFDGEREEAEDISKHLMRVEGSSHSRRRSLETAGGSRRRNAHSSSYSSSKPPLPRETFSKHSKKQQQANIDSAEYQQQKAEIKRLQESVERLERLLSDKKIELDVARDRLDSQTGLIYYLQQQLDLRPVEATMIRAGETTPPQHTADTDADVSRSCLKLPPYFTNRKQHDKKSHQSCLRLPTALIVCQSQATRSTARLSSVDSFEFHDVETSSYGSEQGWMAKMPLLQNEKKYLLEL